MLDISDDDHFGIRFNDIREINCTGEISMKDGLKRNTISNNLFSAFLLFVVSALFGSATVLVQVLLGLPPLGYQFIPLGIFCGLSVMKRLRSHSVSWMLLVLLILLHFSLVHGFAYTKFIPAGSPESFRCLVGAMIGIMMAPVALLARLVPDKRLQTQ